MMTEKQAMGLIYYTLVKLVLLERNGYKNIFSSGDKYMVASLNGQNSSISPLYNTLEEAQAW